MDLIILITGLLIGTILTYLILSLLHRSKHVTKTEHELLRTQFNNNTMQLKVAEDRLLSQQQLQAQLQLRFERGQMELKELQAKNVALETNAKNKTEKINELSQALSEQVNAGYTLQDKVQELNKKLTEALVLNRSLQDQLELQKTSMQQQAEQLTQLNEKNLQLHTDNSEWKANNAALKDRLATQKEEIIELQQTAHLQFEKIAQQIFEDKSGKFTEANKANIEALLKPLGENIDLFKKKVEETYDKESKQRFSLEEKVKELVEQTNKVSSEANNLASALKGQSKKQGNWGEVILESILQQSGLVKNREYFLQQTIKDEAGRSLRPDVLVKLPDNRIIIIDSKVSLVAYDRFSAADNAEQQTIHLAEHLKSVYIHIDELSSKQYDNLDAALDFTMMFVPIEPAYLVAIQADQDLWAYAYAKRVLLVSPTNLIACLKLMADLWKREMQSKNALEIVKRGELLYEKFVSFVSTLEELGRQINKTQQSYTTAIGQLNTGNGHLIGQALKLKNLGLKSSKEISPALLPPDYDPEHFPSAAPLQ
ncbi:MAG: DNA recombination protein RmuC [Taibaiella sp.]|nr:DNA recombination protein RmuC [Taibaiella sp.]